MAEVKTPLIHLAPGETFTAGDGGAVVIGEESTHADIIRYVVADMGSAVRLLVEDALAEGAGE